LKDDIQKIVQSNEHSLIKKRVEEYVGLLRNKIEQNKIELMAQATTCLSTLAPLDIYDMRLKEFVQLHHIDLKRTINYQITKLRDHIYEKTTFQQFYSYYQFDTKQVRTKFELVNLNVVFSCLVSSNHSND